MSDTTITLTHTATLDARLRELLSTAQARSRPHAAAFDDLWVAIAAIAGGGKKVRPRLLLDAYAALGGTDQRAAIDAACAVELLHIALVIHDDVIDRDLTRRGELNITGRFATDAVARGADHDSARGWGEATSILAGDLVLTMAHSVLARLDVDVDRRAALLDAFEAAVHESAAGEHRDVWLSMHLEHAQPQDVLGMMEQKTAAYSFQAPLVLAAILAGSPAAVTLQITGIARRIGVIYQLRDDVLGLFGDEQRTGKSALSDLREGKETLLVAFARSAPSWAQVQTLFGDSQLDEEGAARLRQTIADSGALSAVETVIAEHCTEAHRLIRDAHIPTALRDQLTALTSACSSRHS